MPSSWNLNVLCVDADEDTLKLYQDVLTSSQNRVASITQRYIESSSQKNLHSSYTVYPAMSGDAAVRSALEAKQKGQEIAVGFFDIGLQGKVDGLQCISEVKRIFPSLLCAVVVSANNQEVDKIRELFESQDEWLYIKKPLNQEELLQTACNLVVSWNLRGEQTAAMDQIKQNQKDMQGLLSMTPKLFRQQSYQDLCSSVIKEAATMMATEHAFLAMQKNNRLEFMIGMGKYEPVEEEDKEKFLEMIQKKRSELDWSKCCLVMLSLGELPLGLLFFDDLRQQEVRNTEILELFISQAAYAFENLRIQGEREEQKMREQELRIGKTIQESLLPKRIPQSDDIELFGMMHSAKEIGGDYYDFIHRETPDTKMLDDIFVSIGDVSGKGVAAGLIMSEVRSYIRALIPFYKSPRELLNIVARLLERDIWGTGKFMSLLLMLWDAEAKKFLYTSAGHEHIIHYIAKEKKCSVFKAGGVVLGLKHDVVSPHLKQAELLLDPDDVVVLFTDGVTEAMNEDEDMFHLERVVELTEQYAHLAPKQILNNIFQKICEFMGEYEQFDDITMVAVKRKRS